MKQFYLAEILTKDKLQHQGVYYEPKKAGKRAILYLHGLSSAFHREVPLLEEFARMGDKQGVGFAAFNNRGHDMLAGIRKFTGKKPYGYTYFPGGAGQEVFEDCIYDIDAGIDFLVNQGYSEIVLIGHSTGANKVCYYAAIQKNPNVIAVVLSGPMSDRLDPTINPKHIVTMRKYVKQGKENKLFIGYQFFPITPKRYISLFKPGSTEDAFDYGDKTPKLTFFSRISIPLLVLLAGNDEYADRPQTIIQKVFDMYATSKKYRSVIIPGAVHRFTNKERDAVDAIDDWLRTI